jgi:hypothetical protein
MKWPTKKIRQPVLIFACLVSACWAAQHPTAFELLDKYAETQDRFQSFMAKVETSRSGFSTGLMAGRPWKLGCSNECDARFDKDRASVRARSWGRINPRSSFTKDKPYYVSELWNGETYFRYIMAREEPVHLHIGSAENTNMREGVIKNNYSGKFFMGYFYPFSGRIDSILHKADSLSVRRTMQSVNGYACYVIDAVCEKDRYTVWIDPQNGYNIARVAIERARSNVQGLQSFTVELKNVRLQKIDNEWVPVEANLEDRFDYPNGDYCTDSYYVKLKEMVFDPDHDALRSFFPDDIKDGTKVPFFVGSPNRPYYPQYVWSKDAKFVADRKGRLTKYEPDKGILPVIKTLPKFKALDLKLSPVQTKGKMILLCFCGINQQASQRCALNLAEQASDLHQKNVFVVLVDASGTERKQINAWVKQHTGDLPAGRFNKQLIKEIRQAWGIETLPRLVLTDRNRVITAEGFALDELDAKIKEAAL